MYLVVTSRGAVGDGVTDNTSALQSAIDAVYSAGGGIVFIPEGTFLIASTVYIKSGVLLQGLGAGVSIIKASASLGSGLSAGSQIMIRTEATGGQHDMGMCDLELDGNKANRYSAVLPNGHGWVAYGDNGDPTRRIQVRRCYVHDCPGLGIVNQNVEGLWVEGNEVADCSRDGISSYYKVKWASIRDNYVHGCMDDGIGLNAEEVGSEIFGVVISGNKIVGDRVKESWETYYGSGIAVRGGSDITIENNTIYTPYSSGIQLQTTPFYPDVTEVTIRDNTIWEPGWLASTAIGSGIDITAGTSPTDGAHTGSITGVRVRGNAVIGQRTHALQMYTDSASCSITDVDIDDNRFDGNGYTGSGRPTTGRGVHVDPSYNIDDLRVRRNIIRNQPSHGINIGDGTRGLDRVSISDNRVYDNGQGGGTVSGIYCQDVTDLYVHGNVSRNVSGTTQDYGATFVDCAGVFNADANDFTGNATGEVNLSGNTASPYTTAHIASNSYRGGIRVGALSIYAGSGSPESVVTAPVGSLYLRSDGGASTSVYVKESGTGNTGWVPK